MIIIMIIKKIHFYRQSVNQSVSRELFIIFDLNYEKKKIWKSGNLERDDVKSGGSRKNRNVRNFSFVFYIHSNCRLFVRSCLFVYELTFDLLNIGRTHRKNLRLTYLFFFCSKKKVGGKFGKTSSSPSSLFPFFFFFLTVHVQRPIGKISPISM